MLATLLAAAASEPTLGFEIDPGAIKIIAIAGVIALGAFLWSQKSQ